MKTAQKAESPRANESKTANENYLLNEQYPPAEKAQGKSRNESNTAQPGKANAFTLIKNVRDSYDCKRSPVKKLLMLVLATYCDCKGVCWPSNETLAEKMRVTSRTVQRLISQLAKKDAEKDAEIEILQRGAGRNQRRYISLTRYLGTMTKGGRVNEKTRHNSVVFKHDTYCRPNSHSEQPTHLKMKPQVSPPAVVSEDCLSEYSEAERQFIHIYHRLVCAKDKRWFRVTKYSEELSKALGLYTDDPELFADLCRDALKYGLLHREGGRACELHIPLNLPHRRTLVRLIWENY
jgi:hypothetical protein